ncbi:MAG: Ribose transport system, periplasmic ribose-binding protein RbsB, partial [Gemmataceae bacterium]|nr:Ribose transport system, periplasmic ribose-binding protein RbsB [Gemmataceae bacterium]
SGNPGSLTSNGGGGGAMGGAVFTQGGTVTIANTTIAANTAVGGASVGAGTIGGSAFGGGVFNLNGSVTLTNVTIAGNTVVAGAGGTAGMAAGGAVYNLSLNVGTVTPSQTATLTVANSILANTTGGSDVANTQVNGTATINATGPNIASIAVANTGGTVSGTPFTIANPLLGALASNGGPTQTLLPQTGSPAIGTGTTAVLTAANFGGTAPVNDQRGPGFSRTLAGKVDIGAVEVQTAVGVLALSPSLVVSGSLTGQAQVFASNASGLYSPTPTTTLNPFPGFTGLVRTASADVNGDGTPDTILVTGPGVPIQFAVVSGKDNTTLLIAPTSPFAGSEGFTGGGFVAAGDIERTGRADVVVTPDQGGGPRVTIFALTPTGLVTRANFFGIDDPTFRGGARVAVGDVNGDGTPDVAVAAGFLGGPRIALFNGTTVLSGTPTRLINDFFAFPGTDAITLRDGAYVAIGDVSGDGFGDLIFGGGPGGAPRVFILSGQLVAAGNIQTAYNTPVANFFVANNSTDRGGVRVAAVNADGDTKADVAVGSGQGSPANVRVYLGKNFTGTGEPSTFQDLTVFGGITLADGVYVG